MEELKPLAKLVEPDERHLFFEQFDPETCEYRPLRQEDIYKRAAEVSLHAGVPETIRSHFATALNLLAYSWFYYPFNVTAELLGYVSVEFALKTKYPENKRASLKTLLERAIYDGLLTEAGFSVGRRAEEVEAHHRASPPNRDLLNQVLGAMRELRNDLAHGNSTVHMTGAAAVLFCAELINQLYPMPKDG